MLVLGKWRSNTGAEARTSVLLETGASNDKPGPRGSCILEKTRQKSQHGLYNPSSWN